MLTSVNSAFAGCQLLYWCGEVLSDTHEHFVSLGCVCTGSVPPASSQPLRSTHFVRSHHHLGQCVQAAVITLLCRSEHKTKQRRKVFCGNMFRTSSRGAGSASSMLL